MLRSTIDKDKVRLLFFLGFLLWLLLSSWVFGWRGAAHQSNHWGDCILEVEQEHEAENRHSGIVQLWEETVERLRTKVGDIIHSLHCDFNWHVHTELLLFAVFDSRRNGISTFINDEVFSTFVNDWLLLCHFSSMLAIYVRFDWHDEAIGNVNCAKWKGYQVAQLYIGPYYGRTIDNHPATSAPLLTFLLVFVNLTDYCFRSFWRNSHFALHTWGIWPCIKRTKDFFMKFYYFNLLSK